ncbi:MAG: AI-2E family transporter [Nanoarchaeota archaeon]|nr:AI-2E family transporter [Nanoarchaeota archaeon]
MNNIRRIKEEFSKYFILLFFIIAVYMVFLVIKPFIIAILTSIIISYIFYPLYKWINKKTKRKNLSAVIVTILIITLIITPILFIANSLTREVMVVYTNSKQRIEEGNIIDTEPGSILWKLNSFLVNIAEKPQISSSLDSITNSIISSLSNFIFTIPKRILSFFVMIFLIFFMLRDGELMVKKIKYLIPLKNHYQNKIVKRFGSVTRAVVYGHFITALIQGMVGVLGLYIFGIKSPLVWGGIMMVACMIPFIGAPVVWFPLGVLKLIEGLTTNTTSTTLRGIGLLVYGFFIVASIDNLIKPKIIGDKAKIHPTIILLGVLGGLTIFGVIGIVIGPLVLSLFLTFAEIYKTEII